MPHRILLVEDDARTRARLARAIAANPALCLIADVGSCAEARAQLVRVAPDVLLTDLGLPDGSGADLIRETCAAHPQARSMVITVFGDEAHVVEAIRAGASGYLLKDASEREIGRAIADLLAGGSPISAAVARYLLKHLQAAPALVPMPAAKLVDELSAREIGVLQLVADGCSYAEIATRLFISINTVGTHIKHIYDKLAVNSRGKAVREAEQRGLLTRPRN
ncbi:MAG: response regulator transcription factor [Sinimarinibacterium sp.]